MENKIIRETIIAFIDNEQVNFDELRYKCSHYNISLSLNEELGLVFIMGLDRFIVQYNDDKIRVINKDVKRDETKYVKIFRRVSTSHGYVKPIRFDLCELVVIDECDVTYSNYINDVHKEVSLKGWLLNGGTSIKHIEKYNPDEKCLFVFNEKIEEMKRRYIK